MTTERTSMKNLPPHGTIVLQGTVGSTAYGLAAGHSDIDTLGVHVWPTDYFWKLEKPPETYNGHAPDITLHELEKYLRLAMKGNPTLLELLYLPHELVNLERWEGAQLRQLRTALLSTKAVRGAYGGYAVQQAAKLRNRRSAGKHGFDSDINEKRVPKHGRHIFRLLIQGAELLTTGFMQVNVSERRGEIFEMGELAASDPEAFDARFRREIARLDAVDSVLPEVPDRFLIEQYLYDVRQHWLP